MTPGIHHNLPAEVYHASPGVSNSMLANMDPPARLPVYLSEKREPTPYMRMGTLIHHAILEPGRPMPGIILQPETYPDAKGGLSKWHGGATYCKDWLKNQEAAGMTVLKREEFETLTGCVRALESDPLAAAAFSAGEGEVSLRDALTLPSGRTVNRRARLDWVRPGQVIYDVKKVSLGMGSKRNFERIATDRRYYVQAAFYMDMWNSTRADADQVQAFVFFAVEDAAPYLVSRFEIVQHSRTHLAGRERYMKDLETYAHCCETGIWPGYADGFQELEVMRWAA